MEQVRLVVIQDAFDCVGLALAGMPNFEGASADIGNGLTIAHDVLEHQNGPRNMGPAWDELEAIGGMWYVRGQWGDMSQKDFWNHDIIKTFASDILSTFSTWNNDDDRDMGPDDVLVGTAPHDEDESFQDMIDNAIEMMKSEYEDEDDVNDNEVIEAYKSLSLRSLRKGFQKAKNRFETKENDYWQFNANTLFSAIRDAVEDVRDVDFPGQEFILHYGNGEAYIEEVKLED